MFPPFFNFLAVLTTMGTFVLQVDHRRGRTIMSSTTAMPISLIRRPILVYAPRRIREPVAVGTRASTIPRNYRSSSGNPSRFPQGRQFSAGSSGSDHHAFFQQQLEELNAERKSVFGPSVDTSDSLADVGNRLQQQQRKDSALPKEEMETMLSPGDFQVDLDDLHAERQALFQFTSQEVDSWRSQSHQIGSSILPPQLLQEIAKARTAAEAENPSLDGIAPTVSPPSSPGQQHHHHEFFSHVSPDGRSIHMVDVGQKPVTTRVATAQSKVLLPPEVMNAFHLIEGTNAEMVGPKGPIFATAKLAGIMAAKKTSDLIPLCHPLPLDQVVVDIELQGSTIFIECTCRVTHKTGVEMEALTGASVAALTIYDMVKAVSHKVEITGTRLVAKTGGKRTVDADED